MFRNLKTIITSVCLALWATALSAQMHWSFDYRQYRYDMTVYFSLQNGNEMVAVPANYEVAAFVGDECRGLAIFEDQTGQTGVAVKYGFLKVYSNVEEGETVVFKCYDKTVTKERSFTEVSVPFVSDSNVGYPTTPLPLVLEYEISTQSAFADLGMVEGSGTKKSGTSVTLTATPFEGYKFVGWSNGVQGNPYTFVVDRDVTLTAEFAPRDYTITFMFDNGEPDSLLTQAYKSSVTAPSGFEKTGFTFAGWNKTVPTTMPSRDTTFIAQWTRNSYNLKFMNEDQVVSSEDILYEAPVNTPAVNPQKEGHTFVGWDPAVALTMPAENQVYKAVFSINQYKVIFMANGEIVKSDSLDYGTSIVAPETPEIAGCEFLGWYPEVDLTVPAHDVIYTASYNRNEYYATFVVDGEVKQNNQVTFDEPIEKPANPEKEGYTFKGWQPEVPELMPAYDISFTAEWEINKYAVTWQVDENSRVDSVIYLSSIAVPTNPTKEGYTFTGWSPEIPDQMPAQDLVFTAQFTVNTYSVKFIVDEEVTEDSLAYGTVISTSTPEKEGYTFTGWSPELTEGTTVPARDVTYTAQFSINQYAITFLVGTDTLSTTSQDFGTDIMIPAAPQKTGYTFKEWQPEVPATLPSHDVTFVAYYERNSYQSIFLVDGDTLRVDTLAFEDQVLVPDNPAKVGYTFKGWQPEVLEKMPANDVVYTAQWEAITYTITYNLDGGELTEGVTNVASYTIESEAVTLNNPSREFYTFAGWTGTDLTEATKDVTIAKGSTGNRSYKAIWIVNQYTMTFKLENGEEDVVKKQDYNSELIAPVPTKIGFTFKGWSAEVPATVPGADMTFTAQWERNNYKVNWIVDGQSTTEEFAYESAITKPSNPVKEGYTFIGWDADIPAKMPANDLTFTAQFKVNVYAVIYMVKGKEWARDSVAYGQPIVKKDYTVTGNEVFEGWESDANYITMPAHDVIYTAKLTTGIMKILGDQAEVTVYRLDGSLVGRQMKVKDLQHLTKGVYIINGKKFTVK